MHYSFNRMLVATALICFCATNTACTQATQWDKYTQAGEKWYQQDHHAEAEKSWSLALTEAERFGPQDARLAKSVDNLALVYGLQGKHAEKERVYKRLLAIQEKALGPDHPDVAKSLDNLRGEYLAREKYAEAELVDKRLLAIEEKALGPDHPTIAFRLGDLGWLYQKRGKYAEAEQLYNRSLAIREKTLGPDHPDVATSLNLLGELYQAQSKYAEAERLYKQALAIDEKVPDFDGGPSGGTQIDHERLTALYRAVGKYADAEQHCKRALSIDEKSLGPDHPDVATSLNLLAEVYQAQGKYPEAEKLYKRAVAIDEKALRRAHPYMVGDVDDSAVLRQISSVEKALGSDDHLRLAKNLQQILEAYSELLRKTNRPEQAIQLEARAKAIRSNWAARNAM